MSFIDLVKLCNMLPLASSGEEHLKEKSCVCWCEIVFLGSQLPSAQVRRDDHLSQFAPIPDDDSCVF
jgi:hypothetical protein